MDEGTKNYMVYDGAKVIDCNMGLGVVIGEDSFVKDCSFENKVQINRRNFIVDTKIGCCTYTGMNTVIKHTNIGRFCSVSWNVSCGGASHDYTHVSTSPFYQLKQFGFVDENENVLFSKIEIGNDVWIGMNACILPAGGVKIGNGAIIGSGAVVTKDVPDYAIVVGNPGKILKYRFDEKIIKCLNDIKWWNWPEEIIKKNISLFKSELQLDDCNKLYEIHNRLKKENE